MGKVFVALLLGACFSAPSFASDHGCRVLLCLAAVGGSPSECASTLSKLFSDLAKGRSFPSCSMAGGSTAVQQGRDYWEDCKPGETLQVTVNRGGDHDGRIYTGSAAKKQRRGDGLCVDTANPITTYYEDDGGTYSTTRYASYPTRRRPKSRYIDVAIDGQHQNRTYW